MIEWRSRHFCLKRRLMVVPDPTEPTLPRSVAKQVPPRKEITMRGHHRKMFKGPVGGLPDRLRKAHYAVGDSRRIAGERGAG